MAEWFKAAVLKTVEPRKGSRGSNPFLSASFARAARSLAAREVFGRRTLAIARLPFPSPLSWHLVASACGGAATEEAPAPAISTSAADNLVPGQLARGAALQTEIRSAGHDCNKVIRTFQQGVQDGASVWDAECEGGEEFGVVSKATG